MKNLRLRHLFIVLSISLALTSCREKNIEPATDSETNAWILEQMKYWYYWNDHIPATNDLTQRPNVFFNSLLYKYDATARPDGDRFSWIQENVEELKASLSGESKSTGMHYRMSNYPAGSTDVIGVVLYTVPGSPAAKAGIKRGDIFTGINNQKLTSSNYAQLIKGDDAKTYTLGIIDDKGAVVESGVKKEIASVTVQEDPVHFDTTFQYGSNKVGYFVYQQFVPEPNGSDQKEYDKKLEALFVKFKSSQINSLVVDLRYNPGGYVSSAALLASLIGKVTANDIFYFKEYNSKVTPELEKAYGKTFFYEKFSSREGNIGSQLTNLIILTSSNSASASELLINGLKPFMPVILVGGKTYGKNVGSMTFGNEKAGIKWGLQPIVTKSFNSLHQSDYSVGFTPDFPAAEGVKLYPYGDPRDPLLGEALYRITGSRVVRQGSEALRVSGEELPEIFSTIWRKAGGGNMFFDR